MICYRLYLFCAGHILVREDFFAETDDIASGIAARVADGFSDQCDKFELWESTRIVLNEPSLHAREIAEKAEAVAAGTNDLGESADKSIKSLRESLEASAAALEESAMNANPSLSSEKLKAHVAEIRKKGH